MNNTAELPQLNKGMAEIPYQVKLPMRIAFGVVMQGLRIRIGRSLVTITGVVCGIAFLMSILAGQLVKKGVSEEDACRAEVNRIKSFIQADMPGLGGKTVGLIGSGNMSEVEMRVAEALTGDFGATLITSPDTAPTASRSINAKSANIADAEIIFVMGEGAPKNFDFKSFTDKSLNSIVASTILSSDAKAMGINEAKLVKLARELTQEEQDKIAADKKKDKVRNTWIAIISLLVTVIGITNAMLMSVTERFREIGTMKCLGALSAFVTQMFVMEASLMGLVGGIVGAIFGTLFALSVYTITYGSELVFGSLPIASVLLYCLYSVIAGIVLSVIAALYPARVAASMVPATALRSTI